MKKIALISLLMMSINSFAQKSIVLTFTGAFGSASSQQLTLDSVRIDNTKNNTFTVLKTNFTLTINFGGNDIKPISPLDNSTYSIYPNPFTDAMNIEFALAKADNINIQAYNLTGQLVARYNNTFCQGIHVCKFVPENQGMYLVNISGNGLNKTAKVYCESASVNFAGIKYTGTKTFAESSYQTAYNQTVLDMNATIETGTGLVVNLGDMLKYTGYYGNRVAYINESPIVSKNYKFVFGSKFYRFKEDLLQTTTPCFVNVFYSVSDSLNNGVDYLTSSDFVIKEAGSPISPTESFMYVNKINQVPFRLKTVLMFDNSLSVANEIDTIKKAAATFVRSIVKNQEVALYVFSDQPKLLQDFTADTTKLINAINGIKVGNASTNLYGSIITGLSRWSTSFNTDSLIDGYLIVYTDGTDDQGSATIGQIVSARADKKVYSIGLGNEIDPTVLNKIANPGPFYAIANDKLLAGVFHKIQVDIIQNSNSFYWLNYMTPRRVNQFSLEVDAVNNTNAGTDSYIKDYVTPTNFQTDTLAGVVINENWNQIYGLDSIKWYYNTSNGGYYSDLATTTRLDSMVLSATTYQAKKPPVYTWSVNDTNLVKLRTNSQNNSKAVIYPVGQFSDTAILTLNDAANAFTKKLVIIITSNLAKVITDSAENISLTTATLAGEVENAGASSVTSRGVCWGTSANPTISDNYINVGSGLGAFNTSITGLTPGTTYYVRAYATNSAGTDYGTQQTFTTLSAITFPTLSTSSVSSITQTTATSGGNISSNGGATITASGVCWSTSQNPTTSNSFTTDNATSGNYTSSITGLTAHTTYYVRAYATNSAGTAYGAQQTFTTLAVVTVPTIPTLSTSSVSSITQTTATSGGNISSNGGATITASGVCWSTSQNPTTSNSYTTDNATSGSYTSAITGLTANNTYYVRAYATNSAGTAYGNQQTFTTTSPVGFVLTFSGIFANSQQVSPDSVRIDNTKNHSFTVLKNNLSLTINSNGTGLIFNLGDMLKYTGYYGNRVASINESPTASKNYTFVFGTKFYRFKEDLIQTASPCFVNVFYSVSDSLNNGVDYLTSSDFAVKEAGNPISPSESFMYVNKINQVPYKLKTVLMFDNSLSVASEIDTIKSAAISFVRTISKNQEIALYVFSDQTKLLQDFTPDTTKLINAIKQIKVGNASTNLYGSIIAGLSRWTTSFNTDSLIDGYLIVYTDGTDDQGSSTIDQVLAARANKKVYCIGFGNEIDPQVLNKIANPGPFYAIANDKLLAGVFKKIQIDITQNSNSFYWLNYMTPRRVTNSASRLMLRTI